MSIKLITILFSDGNKAIDFAEHALEANPKLKKAAGLITRMRRKIGLRQKSLLKRSLRFAFLIALLVLAWIFWKPISSLVYQEAVVVSEFFKGKPGTTFELKNVKFETGQTTLSENSKAELQELIKFLKENPEVKGEVAGHTDNTGNLKYNKQLSEQRAILVYNFLIQGGVNPKQIFYMGYGDSKPKKPNTTEENRAANRRIEFIIR